jgi:acetolactate synthase-1/3 small subunit
VTGMSDAPTTDPLSLEDLHASVATRTGRTHVLTILVENKPGVLSRVAGLFARRGFNIDTLAVGPTDDPELSRITLTLDGALHPIDQVTKQLHKLINVLKIRDLEPGEAVQRELAMFKISAEATQRAEVMQIVQIFRGKIVDLSHLTMIVEITGTNDKIAAFDEMIRPFGLVEMARTGEIAVSRGRAET